jgi:ribulose-phosphate 3-epimerase
MNSKKIQISASIMCANWLHIEKDLRILEEEEIDFIHYDIMDGFFAPDYCLGSSIIDLIRLNTKLTSHYHLMVEEPARILHNFASDEGDILSIHYEACRNLHRDIIKIKQMGYKVGVVLNPGTPLTAIEYIVEELDSVTIMTVNPGYAGQKLVPQTIRKIADLDYWRTKDNLNFEIHVDGNVNRDNIPRMVAAGGNVLVGGSSGLFTGGDLKTSISQMRGCIQEGLKLRECGNTNEN